MGGRWEDFKPIFVNHFVLHYSVHDIVKLFYKKCSICRVSNDDRRSGNTLSCCLNLRLIYILLLRANLIGGKHKFFVFSDVSFIPERICGSGSAKGTTGSDSYQKERIRRIGIEFTDSTE
ncbi:hypothetical protein AVEN_108188-1 [Araneus ventricosus]|uniref:Uncharacterized protein n=1 Tax=Araneus ventricosus TaxID=182803 RepID=A0A4Y2M8A6_ARAVE|nr:hypothetical protein AVEN_108188-1 [Araneus ventricosus]